MWNVNLFSLQKKKKKKKKNIYFEGMVKSLDI